MWCWDGGLLDFWYNVEIWRSAARQKLSEICREPRNGNGTENSPRICLVCRLEVKTLIAAVNETGSDFHESTGEESWIILPKRGFWWINGIDEWLMIPRATRRSFDLHRLSSRAQHVLIEGRDRELKWTAEEIHLFWFKGSLQIWRRCQIRHLITWSVLGGDSPPRLIS